MGGRESVFNVFQAQRLLDTVRQVGVSRSGQTPWLSGPRLSRYDLQMFSEIRVSMTVGGRDFCHLGRRQEAIQPQLSPSWPRGGGLDKSWTFSPSFPGPNKQQEWEGGAAEKRSSYFGKQPCLSLSQHRPRTSGQSLCEFGTYDGLCYIVINFYFLLWMPAQMWLKLNLIIIFHSLYIQCIQN